MTSLVLNQLQESFLEIMDLMKADFFTSQFSISSHLICSHILFYLEAHDTFFANIKEVLMPHYYPQGDFVIQDCL
jgi:hypothetical protein